MTHFEVQASQTLSQALCWISFNVVICLIYRLLVVVKVRITQGVINHFKVYNSLAAPAFTVLCSHHPSGFKAFSLEEHPVPIKKSLSMRFSPQPPATTNLRSVSGFAYLGRFV